MLAGGPAVADEILCVWGEILEINLVFCMAFIDIITCQGNAPPLRGSDVDSTGKEERVTG